MDVMTKAQLGLEWAKNHPEYIASLQEVRLEEEQLRDFVNRLQPEKRLVPMDVVIGYRDLLKKHQQTVVKHNALVDVLKSSWDLALSNLTADLPKVDKVVDLESVFR